MSDTHIPRDKIINDLGAPFRPDQIRHRTIGGGFEAKYIDGATFIERINSATGNAWDFTVDKYWNDDTKSYALVTITIPGLGSRQHIGVQLLNDRSGEDALAKGAITDAMKKAGTLFGIGLDLYADDPVAASDSPIDFASNRGRRLTDTSSPTTTSSQEATPRQIKFIQAMARERGISDEFMNGQAKELYGVDGLDSLTRQQASQMIENLQAKRMVEEVSQ